MLVSPICLQLLYLNVVFAQAVPRSTAGVRQDQPTLREVPRSLQEQQHVSTPLLSEMIYYMIEEFQKILSDKESILLKVNSLFALNLCVQTCEYAILELIEAFLLPLLNDTALYQA